MRRLLALASLALVPLGLAACGSSQSKGGAGGSPRTGTAARLRPAVNEVGCRPVRKPVPRPPQRLRPPRGTLSPARRWTATLSTSCGPIVIRLDVRRSPRTTSSFTALARRGFYDGLLFHRVARGFVIQGGDPRGDGTGGPGYETVEPPPRSTHYTRGTVAMAKAANDPRGAAGSQFFIVTAEDATVSGGLTPDYAVLGRVVGGMRTVSRIESIPTNPPGDNPPRDPVLIDSVRISGR